MKARDEISPAFERATIVVGVDQMQALRERRVHDGVSVSHQIRQAIDLLLAKQEAERPR